MTFSLTFNDAFSSGLFYGWRQSKDCNAKTENECFGAGPAYNLKSEELIFIAKKAKRKNSNFKLILKSYRQFLSKALPKWFGQKSSENDGSS